MCESKGGLSRGAYALSEHDPESQSLELKYYAKNPGAPIPDEQRDCAVAIADFFADLQRANSLLVESTSVPGQSSSFLRNIWVNLGGKPKEARPVSSQPSAFVPYARQARKMFFVGCVKDLPEPKLAAEQLKKLRATFYEDVIGNEIEVLRASESNVALLYLLGVVAVYVVLRQYSTFFSAVNPAIVSQYALVGIGAMAALVLSHMLRKTAGSIAEFVALRRTLKSPFRHALSTLIAAVVLSLCLKTEMITLKLGKAASSDIETDAGAALIAGFLTGLLASYLLRKLFAKYTAGAD